ncbi:CRISPR-associated endonuclease Cas1 [Acidianus sulfidivorans JP7]|uniref:CRISPR-associated endonuclease Cas1 n=1 Tax=Acidianus sulfidivorans JP7 TaxID=619593 RepID=A0A2U9IQ13_9CREN|nr:CRISPR-associated endonuclease Cas1 [Acidianus sulfidivorans]AWR98102.1 CRISPR-associated endonuclease Cas1 [Acidianus sulfidivorans JP7]
MRTLVISDYGAYVYVKNNMLVIKKGDKKVEISPSEVDEILITSSCSISTSVLLLALTHGISVMFLNSRDTPWGILLPSVVTETVKTKKAQYEAVVVKKEVKYGEEIISSKIYNQSVHLKYWARVTGTRNDHRELLGKDEPTAARIYWQNISRLLPKDIRFDGRDVDSTDQFNIALNYSYAILYNTIFKYLVIAGLDPYLGFIHKDRPGNESLVYDFSEMFKPYIDFLLVKALRNGFRLKIEDGLIEENSRGDLAKLIRKGMDDQVKEESDHNPKTLIQAIRAHAIKLASSIREGKDYNGFRLVL